MKYMNMCINMRDFLLSIKLSIKIISTWWLHFASGFTCSTVMLTGKILASWWHIASRCCMPRTFQKDSVDLSQKSPQLPYCISLSVFTFPLLWHFHCCNQRPFPLGLSTVKIENSCSPILWIIGSLCTSGYQVFKVTSNTWRGHRGGEFWSWKWSL